MNPPIKFYSTIKKSPSNLIQFFNVDIPHLKGIQIVALP